LQCTFSKEAWFFARSWKGITVQVLADNASVGDWWHAFLSNLPRQKQRRKAALMIYTTWIMEGKEIAESLMADFNNQCRCCSLSKRRFTCAGRLVENLP